MFDTSALSPTPKLLFPLIPVGPRESPYDLSRLLYEGGPALLANQVAHAVQAGLLGQIKVERLSLVHAIHEFINDKLVAGGTASTARGQIKDVTAFFAWCENASASLRLAQIEQSYLDWAEHLYHRYKVAKAIEQNTAYSSGLRVGQVLDGVLERDTPLILRTRLRRPKSMRTPMGMTAERQILSETFAFGHLLQDVSNGVTSEVVWDVMDVKIPRQNGEPLTLWTGGSVAKNKSEWATWEIRDAEARRLAYAGNRSLKHRGRRAIINTRILAEMLNFIAQTGMNVSQAHKLEFRHFSYTSHIDGYIVRTYKGRAGGGVEFEIFSDYRPHFERYLAWRRAIFPKSKKLFPILREGSREDRLPRFDLIIGLCKQAGVQWIPPSVLRGTRVNWYLRRSGDADLTAEVAQHHKQETHRTYEWASLHRSAPEVVGFWRKGDPSLAKAGPQRAAGPGSCDGRPEVVPDKPTTAPIPDCTQPSGCFWCNHHRDVDSLEYVWSLASLRHLKVLEMSKHLFPTNAPDMAHPAQHVVDKVSAKLDWFKQSNVGRTKWVTEALERVEEGDYHEAWKRRIELSEGAWQ